MTTETAETTETVADTAGLTFTADFLTLSTFKFGPRVAVHLTDQSGHRWVTEWYGPGHSGTTYCLSFECAQPGHRAPNGPLAYRLDIPAARKVALAHIAEQGLTRFLVGGQA